MAKAPARPDASGFSPDFDVRVLADGSTYPADVESLGPELTCLARGFIAQDLTGATFLWTGSTVPRRIRIERSQYRGERCARMVGETCRELPFGVTLRELDIVTLIVAGMTNPAIAAGLHVSLRTVTTHVDHVMRKLGVVNRAAVAALALDHGLIGLPLPANTDGLDQLSVGRMLRSASSIDRLPPGLSARRTSGPSERILIGALIPSRGSACADAVEMLQGAQLALEEINARGGIANRMLAMDVVDVDADDPVSARQAIDQLMLRRPLAITSGYLAAQAAVMDVAAAEGIPFLHSSASAALGELVSGDSRRHQGAFQFSPDDEDYAPFFVSFLTTLRDSGAWVPTSNRICFVIQARWDLIDLGIDAASRDAEMAGWEPFVVTAGDREDRRAGWSEAAARVQADSPAAAMIGSYFPQDHARFIREFSREPAPTLLYSVYAPSVPGFGETVGGAGEGVVWASTTGTYTDELGAEFFGRYHRRFGCVPGRSHAGIAYDRIHILAQAWRQVSDVRDFDDVADCLSATRYRGVNGSYSFDASRHRTLSLGRTSSDPSLAQAHTVFQVQDGKDVLISPAPYAGGTFRLPPWMSPVNP